MVVKINKLKKQVIENSNDKGVNENLFNSCCVAVLELVKDKNMFIAMLILDKALVDDCLNFEQKNIKTKLKLLIENKYR